MLDEWQAHNLLGTNGNNHLTVNHSSNFVNLNNVAHTQNIENL